MKNEIVKGDFSNIFDSKTTERIKEIGTFHVDKVLIPLDNTSAKVVYFVSDTRGNEYGQFNDKIEALAKFSKVIGG